MFHAFTETMRRLFHMFIGFRPFFGKIFLLTLTIGSLVTIILWASLSSDVTKAKDCFRLKPIDEAKKASIILFDDVMESKRMPTPGKSIFFHETSCSKTGLVQLNARYIQNCTLQVNKNISNICFFSTFRQACAIESAAMLNPNWDVFVLFASPVGLSNETNPNPFILKALQSYPNIYFRNINLWTYSSNTPLEDWFLSDELFLSKYLNSHVSDFLRYVSLYKFGGTYLDLDVVVQKTLENITTNYAGAESENFVAAGVISFENDGIGHEIAEMCIRLVNFTATS